MKTLYAIDTKADTVRTFSSKEEAGKNGNGFSFIYNPEDLENHPNIGLAKMVAIFNKMTGQSVKRFPDKKTGAKRLFAEFGKLTVDTTTKVRTQGHKTAAPKPPKGKSKRDLKLEILTKYEAPFRANTQSGRTWEMIKANPNKTFNEYIALGGRANTISHAIRNEWLGYLKEEG